MVKHRLGDTKAALKDIRKSIDMFPSNSYAFRNLAIIHLDTGENKSACEACKRAIELGFSTNYGEEMNEFYKQNCSK